MCVFFIIPNLHSSAMSNLQLLFILLTISNLIVYLNTQYVGTPQAGVIRQVALKRSFELKCQYTGIDDSGEFVEWFKEIDGQNVSINSEKPGHYSVKNHAKDSTLHIKIFVQADANVNKWFVVTKKLGHEVPAQCQFGAISLIPSPQGIEDNHGELLESRHASIRRTEGQSITLKCFIEPNSDQRNKIRWEYSKDDKTFTELPDGIDNMLDSEIQIGSVKKYHRGYYRCMLNDVSFTVLLRVKDRLAALWPFLGIVGVLVILVIIILIFEKRQKSNKKLLTTDDEDQDQASDPLVRTTTRSSDNDNKKRAVKA